MHPGYGFLSENAKFARLVQECDMTFVGPNPKLIQMMGDKTQARKLMKEAGVPVVEGCEDALKSVEDAKNMLSQLAILLLSKHV